MEDILDVYELPYNSQIPVVYMDEKPYQLLGEAREPLPMRPGNNSKIDSEYVRNGTCSIFVFNEPLGGIRHVSVRKHRTATDWAEEIKYLADVMYPKAEKIILVMDNLNTHKSASLYKKYPPAEARRIIKCLEIHYTPKHGSWLDMAEIELNVRKSPRRRGEYHQGHPVIEKKLPTRSAAKIITMLELAGRIPEDLIQTRTANRILQQYGYTRESLAKDKRLYIKHEKDRICDMWQSDVMSAFYIPDGNNGHKMAYLIGMIDDHSRRDMHSEFYFDSTLPRLEDTLRKAVTKFGAPVSLYVDNGKIFVSEQFKLICARLGIRIRFATPFNCSGKGKIERYWQTVQNSFLPEVKKQHVRSLSELNDLYFAWKKAEYDEKTHSSTGMTPKERWDASIQAGAKLRFFSPVELEEIFLHAEERTVNKYGVISFEGNTYEAPAELISRSVIIRYNPFHIDYLYVYFNDKYFGVAKIIDLKTERHRSVSAIPEESGYDSKISHLYFENIKSNYQKYLEDQLEISMDKDVVSSGSNMPEGKPEPHPVKPPIEVEFTIERDEFIDIVKNAIGMTELTFQEKGKLNELWDTFKEFNKDILVSILDDLSHKASDFNRNFLYYIAQIRSKYLEKLSKAKESAND